MSDMYGAYLSNIGSLTSVLSVSNDLQRLYNSSELKEAGMTYNQYCWLAKSVTGSLKRTEFSPADRQSLIQNPVKLDALMTQMFLKGGSINQSALNIVDSGKAKGIDKMTTDGLRALGHLPPKITISRDDKHQAVVIKIDGKADFKGAHIHSFVNIGGKPGEWNYLGVLGQTFHPNAKGEYLIPYTAIPGPGGYVAMNIQLNGKNIATQWAETPALNTAAAPTGPARNIGSPR